VSESGTVYFFLKVYVMFSQVLIKIEAEIASSAEYVLIDSIYSLINQTNSTFSGEGRIPVTE